MSPHKLRKTRKKRGSRTCGYGRVGQHRGRGTKGMRKAGFDKHAWTYVVKYEPDYFGKRGFTCPRSLGRKISVINVGELEELVDKLALEGRLQKVGRKILLNLEELGYDKLLARGSISRPILVKVKDWSENAARKLEEAGGGILREEAESQ